MNFAGKSVLVTGASKGIGLATARRFLELGANVTVCASSERTRAEAVEALDGDGRVASAAGDLREVHACRAAVSTAVETFGGVDVLVANAGYAATTPVEEVTEDDWDHMIDVNLKSTFFCAQAAIAPLRAAKGAIVTVSSDAGLTGIKDGWATYAAAKAGVVSLTRSLALDLAPEVRVNSVAPAFTDTPGLERVPGDDPSDPTREMRELVPLNRIAQPEEVAEAIVYLSGATFVTGTVLSIDGGISAGY
jgi:meso-butanediol dehydrogenase/(S,S)-butanediol dehydrogenase/diacetyl reductase